MDILFGAKTRVIVYSDQKQVFFSSSHAISSSTAGNNSNNNNNRKSSTSGSSSNKSLASSRIRAKVASVKGFTSSSSSKMNRNKSRTKSHASTSPSTTSGEDKKSKRLHASDNRKREKSSDRLGSGRKGSRHGQALEANSSMNTSQEHEDDQNETEETSEDPPKSPLVKNNSLDELFAKVNMLKSLYPNIVEKTSNKDKEGEEGENENEEQQPGEEGSSAKQVEVKEVTPPPRKTKIVFQITDYQDEEPKKDDQESKIDKVQENVQEKPESEQPDIKSSDSKDASNKKGDGAISLETICEMFSGVQGKKTFKDIVKEEVRRETTELEKMMSSSQTVAVGRRVFDKEEIIDDNDEESEPDEDDLMAKVKKAKPKYLQIHNKATPEPSAIQEEEPEIDTNPKNYGLWDSVSNVKILPTILRTKKEWQPPDWENIMRNMKEQGRDLASIDADLKAISQSRSDMGKKKTGKYLMPEDLSWCRKHTKFSERQLLKWFKKFRAACSNGQMEGEQFCNLFVGAYPWANVDKVMDIIGEIFLSDEQTELDFKVSMRGCLWDTFIYYPIG